MRTEKKILFRILLINNYLNKYLSIKYFNGKLCDNKFAINLIIY